MTITEAIETLNAAIPSADNKMVDAEHLPIALAWGRIKALLASDAKPLKQLQQSGSSFSRSAYLRLLSAPPSDSSSGVYSAKSRPAMLSRPQRKRNERNLKHSAKKLARKTSSSLSKELTPRSPSGKQRLGQCSEYQTLTATATCMLRLNTRKQSNTSKRTSS